MKKLPFFERSFVKKLTNVHLLRIAEALSEQVYQEPEPGLLTGLAGQSIFLYHYGQTTGSDRYENLGFLAIQRVLEMIDNGFSWPSYAAGLAGIRYALKYLEQRGFLSTDYSNALDGMKPLLEQYAADRLREGDFDFLHGALGILMYPDQSPGKEPEIVLDDLLRQAIIPAENQLAWFSTNPKTGVKEINLGLAHGVPSILLLLSRFKSAVELEPIVNFLLDNRLTISPNGSLFPHRLIKGEPDKPGRLAWCYGDLGVAMALWLTGAHAGRADWQVEASAILRKATKRTSLEPNRLFDTCLCHGTAGLALIFYKMGELTGHQELSDAAIRWVQATFDFGGREGFAGGFSYFTTGDRYVSNYGLLEGIAGTGLVLLSLLEPDNLGWESALMI